MENSLFKQLRITRIIKETRGAHTFVLEAVGDWLPVYKAGQFLTLVFFTKHGEKRRSYSISSSPALNEPLSITVKEVENGEFSRFMMQHLKEGDLLHTTGVSGLFRLPEPVPDERHFCFLAAGSGIVPCYSLIKTLLHTTKNKITLIYSNKNEEQTLFMDALLEWQQAYATRFKIRFLFSASNDILSRRLSKWLLDQLLDQYFETDIETALFYLCGPFEYMQTVEITLRSRVPKEHILKENFSSLPRLKMPEPPDKNEHQVKVRIQHSTYTFPAKYPRSILASAKAQGIELPYSCEAGRCSSCVATCTKGKVWMAYNEVLVDKELEAGRILVCQSFPVGGDVEIVYDNT